MSHVWREGVMRILLKLALGSPLKSSHLTIGSQLMAKKISKSEYLHPTIEVTYGQS